jgi:NitT/TauT family transport system substrate-binding protein
MIRRTLSALAVALALALPSAAVHAETTIKVAWCARTLSSAASPFAIARKFHWFGDLRVDPVPLPGSTDCMKAVATHDIPYALASVEPLAIIWPQGVRARVFYTAYQGNVYGIAVPVDSPIHSFADLKGKTIGVTSMASGGFVVARAQVASAGLNPDTDVRIVVAGEGAQTAALVNAKQVDALSQFDTQYVLVENAGPKLRMLDTSAIARFPSNGFIALEETLKNKRAEAATVARGYAMGQVYAMANPEAAIRIMYEVFPQVKPTGKDEATAIADDVRALQARAAHWRLSEGGVTHWGESSMQNYQDYLDFLVKWNVIKQPVRATDIVTNDLLPEIDRFDQSEIEGMAKRYKP